MRLYLVRHAQTQWNAEGRAQGHTDIPLDSNGIEQAHRLAAAFKGVEIERVLTSDLARSVATAEAISGATGGKLQLLTALRERCLGEWEGSPFEVMWADMAKLQSTGIKREHVAAPKGESIQMVWDRLDPVCAMLDPRTGPVAIVTHGGTGSLLLAKLLKGTVDTARSFRFGNASITELHLRPDGFYLIARYNDTWHLDDLAVREGDLEGTVR